MVDNIEVITVYPGYLEIRFYIDKRIRFPLPEDFVYRDKKMLERKRILHYMEENSCITAKEIALMEQVSLSTVNYRIKRLKQEGRIYFDGRGGKGKWVVVTKE